MGIKKLGRGRYLARATRRVDGVRTERKQLCGSEKEARQALAKLEAELEELAQGHEMVRETLGDFAPRWIEQRAERLKASTLAKYVNDLEQHILPALGHRYLDELFPRDIEAYLREDSGSANNKRNRLALLRQLARSSVAEGLAVREWTLTVRAPTAEGYSEEAPNRLEPPELARMLAAIPIYWRTLVVTLAFTGLRFGEVTGLRWEDVDLDAAPPRVRIRRTNWKGMVLPAPKNKRARRTVALPVPVPELLRGHEQRLEAGGLRACGWVFPTRRGTLHCGSPLRRVLDKACAAAGAQRITTHGLRRSFNDAARKRGDGIVVRAIVGHADEAMTEHYSAVSLDEKLALAQSVADAVSGGLTGGPGEAATSPGPRKT